MKWGDVSFASGVLLKDRGKLYVVTAAHYLDIVDPDDMTVMFPPNEMVGVSDPAKLAEVLGHDWKERSGKPYGLKPRAFKRSQAEEDIAVIEIDPTMAPPSCWYFEPADHKGLMAPPAVGDEIIICGLPTQASVIEQGKEKADGSPRDMHLGRVPFDEVFRVIAMDSTQWPEFDKSHHFAVDYRRSKAMTKIHPAGLSGGGIWRSGWRMQGSLEMPFPTLVGIQHSFRPELAALKGTFVERVLSLLV